MVVVPGLIPGFWRLRIELGLTLGLILGLVLGIAGIDLGLEGRLGSDQFQLFCSCIFGGPYRDPGCSILVSDASSPSSNLPPKPGPGLSPSKQATILSSTAMIAYALSVITWLTVSF